jgi:hypothetical protein
MEDSTLKKTDSENQKASTVVASSSEDADTIQKTDSPTLPSHDTFLHGRQLVLVHGGLLMTTFLVALDQSIVSTALPRIASEFNQLEQISWVVSAYFRASVAIHHGYVIDTVFFTVTQAGLLLFFGSTLRIVSTKSIFLFCICIFEAGSLICALAPSMDVLIFGRAVQGMSDQASPLLLTPSIHQGLAVREDLSLFCPYWRK